ncbi:proline-rich transmembrane protein 1-like [Astyanax mexicanus]|uniref:Uncharacterized protein n=2 Tax=Astyanax mexicanus TaxID=7994 RepID=A0A3B1JVH4_ASTMX|nr:proline-rich transmembrane protein 1-like [Astyanax mexicanus]
MDPGKSATAPLANWSQFQGPYTDQPSVMVQPTVYVTSGPLAQPLPDYLGYSIFTMLCCCLPLGVAALVYSINVSDKPVCLSVLSLLHTFTFTSVIYNVIW